MGSQVCNGSGHQQSTGLKKNFQSQGGMGNHATDEYVFAKQSQIPQLNPQIIARLKNISFGQLPNPPPFSGNKLPPFELKSHPGFFYLGQWNQKLPHGRGKIISENLYLEGYFNQGTLGSIDGIQIQSDGSYYQGSFKNNKMHGKGRYQSVSKKYFYEGDWEDNLPSGKGTEVIWGHLTYEGGFYRGKRHGTGSILWVTNEHFQGEFKNGKFHGKGEFASPYEKFTGEYSEGRRVRGKLQNSEGFYTGLFVDDLMEDPNGRFVWRKNQAIYEGGFKSNQKHGQGRITHPDGHIEIVTWNHGELNKSK